MDTREARSQRLVALSLLGFLMFNYPILALFNQAVLLFGIPLIYAYIFAAWTMLIILLAAVIRHSDG